MNESVRSGEGMSTPVTEPGTMNATVFDAAQHYFKIKNPVMVVAGDAARIAKPLSHFAKVVIVDPEHDFQPGKQLPMDANQGLEALPEGK